MIQVEGEYSLGYIPVKTSVAFIPERLKEIDDRFFVMFNIQESKFEVHVRGQENTTYGCTLPFDELDGRALYYVRRFSQERFEQTIREMEESNAQIDRAVEAQRTDNANQKMKEAYQYLDRHESAEELPKELINA